VEDRHFSQSALSWGKWGSHRGAHWGAWNGRKGLPVQFLQFLICVSQFQPDFTLSQVTLRSQELLGDVVYLLLGSLTKVLQSVHQCPLSPETVNLPMKMGISLHHEGFVYRKLLRRSFLQLLPYGRCHVDWAPCPPPHVDGVGPNLLSLTIGPKDHGVIWRILDVGGQVQPPTFVPTPSGTVRGVLDIYGVEHTPQRIVGDIPHWSLIIFFGILYPSFWRELAATSSSSSKTSLLIVRGTPLMAVVVPLAGVLSGADTGEGERVASKAAAETGAE